MIKVLHTPLEEKTCIEEGEEQKKKADSIVKYILKEDESGIELSFTVRPIHDNTYKVRFDYDQYAGKIIEIALVTTDKVNELKVYPIYDTVVQSSFLQNKSVSDIRIARVVFDETCENTIVLLCKDSDDILGFENIVFDRKKESAVGVLASHSEYFANKLRRRKVKAEMINKVDIYATITYLESQVDALTRLVLTLAPECEEKSILQWADIHSVLNIKSSATMIEELKNDKGKIRELQRRYYDAKKQI